MNLKSFLAGFFLLTAHTLWGQKNAISLSLGYHYNPDDFYLSPAELDSAFSPEQGLRFGARFKFQSFFNESAHWAWHLQMEYSHRSVSYQFQTPFTGEQKFNGNLEGRYLDLGLGIDQRFEVKEDLRMGWSATAAVGIPFQSDTSTAELPPYPLRRATDYLPYIAVNLVSEYTFSKGEKGHWVVSLEPTARLYTRPLHKQEAGQGVFTGLGFLFGIGYVFY